MSKHAAVLQNQDSHCKRRDMGIWSEGGPERILWRCVRVTGYEFDLIISN
jgi:hypothetical protein